MQLSKRKRLVPGLVVLTILGLSSGSLSIAAGPPAKAPDKKAPDKKTPDGKAAGKKAAGKAPDKKAPDLNAEMFEITSLSNTYAAVDNAREGIEEMTRRLQKRSSDQEAILARALLKASIKDTAGAIADANSAIKAAPKQLAPYMVRSAIFASQRDWKNAIADMDHVYRVSKTDDALQALGEIKLKSGDTAGALAIFNQRLVKNPKDKARVYQFLSMCHRKMGDSAAFKKDAVILTELEPENPQRWDLLAEANQQLEDYAAAAQAYKRAGTLYLKQGVLSGAKHSEMNAVMLEKLVEIRKKQSSGAIK